MEFLNEWPGVGEDGGEGDGFCKADDCLEKVSPIGSCLRISIGGVG